MLILLKWFLLALTEKLMDLQNFLTAPIVALFADNDGWLPKWLWWWQTPDNPLDGDIGWNTKYKWFIGHPRVNEGWRRWWNRIFWMYRNSMYGYSINVCGFTRKTGMYFVRNDGIAQSPKDRDKFGLIIWKAYTSNHEFCGFQLFYVKPYNNNKRCIRINLGWKLWAWDYDAGPYQCVLSINPWMPFETR